MQVVILAAGRGERMGALTDGLPKPLLEVAGKTLLEHKFDILPEDISEIVLVVGYMGGKIHDRFGGMYKDKKLFYVEQGPLRGTAGALSYAAPILQDRFLVMMGDDIYAADDIARCREDENAWALLVAELEDARTGGSVSLDAKANIRAIQENHEAGGAAGLTSTNMFVLDTRFFEAPMVPKAEGSEELGLPQTALAAATTLGVPFKAVRTHSWIQITTPEDLKKAEDLLENRGI